MFDECVSNRDISQDGGAQVAVAVFAEPPGDRAGLTETLTCYRSSHAHLKNGAMGIREIWRYKINIFHISFISFIPLSPSLDLFFLFQGSGSEPWPVGSRWVRIILPPLTVPLVGSYWTTGLAETLTCCQSSRAHLKKCLFKKICG